MVAYETQIEISSYVRPLLRVSLGLFLGVTLDLNFNQMSKFYQDNAKSKNRCKKIRNIISIQENYTFQALPDCELNEAKRKIKIN